MSHGAEMKSENKELDNDEVSYDARMCTALEQKFCRLPFRLHCL